MKPTNTVKRKGGSRKVKQRILNAWTEEQLQDALHELDSVPSTTIRGVAKRHGINEATIRFRLKIRKLGEDKILTKLFVVYLHHQVMSKIKKKKKKKIQNS